MVLDHGKRAGGAWQHRWPSLRLDRVHGIHDLPGLSLTSAVSNAAAAGERRVADVVSEYFDTYERVFELPVRRPVHVRAVRDGGDGRLLVHSPTETWTARAVINATGTWDRPFLPYYPGKETFAGRQLHAAEFTHAAEFHGQHVVVVGGGTSAVHLLAEIAEYAADTIWVTRRPPVFREAPFTHEDGRAAVARVERAVRAGKPPQSVVSVTGLPPTAEVERAQARGVLDRKPMFERITSDGVRWADGSTQRADVIVWATGFRPATDHLAPLRLRGAGGGIRLDGTRVVVDPRLHLVGYGPSASTVGATRAGRAAVAEIRQLLELPAAHR